ncbi:hypothetical protein E8E11_001681 [Didymella keratinophila]|nr:hypothetical protein E8E11_001681 [Didymella keratinophila]
MSHQNTCQYSCLVDELDIDPAKAYSQVPTYVNKVDESDNDRPLYALPMRSRRSASPTPEQAESTTISTSRRATPPVSSRSMSPSRNFPDSSS